jgi:hypothetical protein
MFEMSRTLRQAKLQLLQNPNVTDVKDSMTVADCTAANKGIFGRQRNELKAVNKGHSSLVMEELCN